MVIPLPNAIPPRVTDLTTFVQAGIGAGVNPGEDQVSRSQQGTSQGQAALQGTSVQAAGTSPSNQGATRQNARPNIPEIQGLRQVEPPPAAPQSDRELFTFLTGQPAVSATPGVGLPLRVLGMGLLRTESQKPELFLVAQQEILCHRQVEEQMQQQVVGQPLVLLEN